MLTAWICSCLGAGNLEEEFRINHAAKKHSAAVAISSRTPTNGENKMRPVLISCLAAAAIVGTCIEANAQSSCGPTETVPPGDTLADLAERCDVRLGDLLNENPDLDTIDVPAGTEVKVPTEDEEDILSRTGDALRAIGNQIQSAARRGGQSVSQYLSDNPDLNRDILEWGEELGLPGINAPPEMGAHITLSKTSGSPGEQITIQAEGLRGNTEVTIGAVAPQSEFGVLDRSTTNSLGEIEATVEVPDWAGDELVFVVETENVRVTSREFRVERPGSR